MTPEKIETIARNADNISFTDEELKDQIEALRLVTAYLGRRKHCHLVWVYLHNELILFERHKEVRKK